MWSNFARTRPAEAGWFPGGAGHRGKDQAERGSLDLPLPEVKICLLLVSLAGFGGKPSHWEIYVFFGSFGFFLRAKKGNGSPGNCSFAEILTPATRQQSKVKSS